MVNVREKTLDEIEERLEGMTTALNKINYLDSAVREQSLGFEIKRILWEKISKLYEERGMLEKAGKAMSNKASLDALFKDRMEDYLAAAELFARAGKVDDADEMFNRAARDLDEVYKMKVRLARKNIYLVCAKDLETRGKKASAAKFYEKLIKMKLEDVEKEEIKEKLIATYKALGMFREVRLIEGL